MASIPLVTMANRQGRSVADFLKLVEQNDIPFVRLGADLFFDAGQVAASLRAAAEKKHARRIELAGTRLRNRLMSGRVDA